MHHRLGVQESVVGCHWQALPQVRGVAFEGLDSAIVLCAARSTRSRRRQADGEKKTRRPGLKWEGQDISFTMLF